MPTIGVGEPDVPMRSTLGTMNGTWRLDKLRGKPSMRGYLETMGVPELAIEAHEKGEEDHETIHTIEFSDTHFKIKKQSRVTDMGLELKLGEECLANLPGDRVKTTIATSESPGQQVKIVSRMPTMNGMANVVDTKMLQREGNLLVLVQTLTIKNELSGKEHTTTRYFVPHEGASIPLAATAKGSVGKK
mmetsp:Transcript_10713/g.17691  ORF Transcript_10713/g.17691 Transcript_10713/m.17691 type:complete len:189 (-) Transcript_10713:1938-2504(-)